MKHVLRFLVASAAAIALVCVHLSIAAAIPYPWSNLNGIFALLVLGMVATGRRSIVWVGFTAHFLLELYTVAPYGIMLFSATSSLLLTFWLYRYFFTNRSWYAAGVLALGSILVYRLLFMALSVLARMGTTEPGISLGSLPFFLWEAILTGAFVAGIYLILSRIIPRLRTAEIHA